MAITDELKKYSTILFSLALLIFLAWITRPWWHWFFMWVYRNPAVWEALILIGLIFGIISWLRKGNIKDTLFKGTGILLLIGFIVVVILLAVFQKWYSQSYLAQNLQVKEITKLSEIDPNFVRITPLKVAERYAMDALQYPRYTLNKPDIAMVEDKPFWVFALIPDGLINAFKIKDKGALYVDMTTSEKNARVIEKDLEIGPGMLITDSIYWNIFKRKYWIDLEDLYLIPHADDLYIAVPYITYEFRFRFPTFFPVPRWGGTILVHSNGEMEFLNPSQAREHPVLAEQKIFPEKLTRYYINSFRYLHGIVNRLFYHQEQLEIADVPEQANPQPFLVKTKEGLKWFVACEPFGKAHGIFRVYQIDARTGEIEFAKYSAEEMLLGPVKSSNYVRKENPIIDWSRMMPVEPIPIVLNGILYWEVRIIPNEGSGVAYTAFVNSLSGEVIEFETDEEIRDSLESGIVKPKEEPEEASKEKIIEEIKDYLKKIEQRLKELE